MRALTILLFCCFSIFGFSQNNQVFEDANALYNDGKYAEAIDKYETILDSNEHSAELYFNLANANYKLNNIAPTIYYYEKALLLNPEDKEIQNNLSFAQNMTIDAIEKMPDVGFSKIINNAVKTFSTDTWAKIAVGGVLLFVIIFLTYHFSYTSSKKRLAFIVSVVSLIVAFVAVAMAFQKASLDKKNNPAIVFVQESRVKTDPNPASEEVFRLHEGTKVQVIETFEGWQKIKLPDNSMGWIASEDIKLLKFF
ncbi:tetratricopeptide repeat protein [Winogradskyella wichelsiae]|uniref:tetratricopeptide repeat protein n=1 Tax=Winogradskyella wichelsiae TaxID=2697007 RepID=UPI0015C8B646|nr:SH3 domain-containing protein [Winogradskyella wichelsiae]